jgi:hypothetical protein
MENHIIIKEDGTRIPWKKNRLNKSFCLLYHDNNQKYIFTPQKNLKCELFMIGGGGAGGYYFGGGGGAGAAYMNNNFTFEQGKTYTFSIGTGGSCDIRDFDKLFNSGLSLNVYNNTSPNFNNISFSHNDYSSLGITSSGIMQSFIVDNININPTIFNTNTTYIWDGYIKSNPTADNNTIVTIRFTSKIKAILWVNTYKYTFDNAIIKVSGDNNIEEVKILQLDPNKYYNIKIIAYNYDTSNNANFNVIFENCKLYNFNKTYEDYNVIPATDTVLTFKTISSNENNVISCKGGGTGGFGLYKQNNNLNGGCGGGSGINKINGITINNNPIYNGYDGAIGDYCGGGGGILSPGNNDKGGEGKIINWFDETLIFGTGGNGANINERRNLGYGCGGNGGDCCYFSKSLINNNGNNGCILIYINDSSDIIEHFTANNSLSNYKDIDYLTENSSTIASKLIVESFKIIHTDLLNLSSSDSRKSYFNSNLGYSFAKFGVDRASASDAPTDNNDVNNFIYDVLVISKLYGIIYRLYYNFYTTTCNSNPETFKDKLTNVRIQFSTDTTSIMENDSSNITTITISNLFDITNLNLGTNVGTFTNDNHYTIEGGMYIVHNTTTIAGSPRMTADTFNNSKVNIGTYPVPIYHNTDNGNKLNGLNDFATNGLANTNKINAALFTGSTYNTDSIINSGTADIKVNFYESASNLFVTKQSIKNLYNSEVKNNIYITAENKDEYKYTRLLLYLEAFNNILNTSSYNIFSILKYNMYNYNIIVYNVSIQYQIFHIQKDRVNKNETPAFVAGTSAAIDTKITDLNKDITNLTFNIYNIIEKNINNSEETNKTISTISSSISNINNTDIEFQIEQNKLNKTINIYNSELEKYNQTVYNYKIIIILAIFLILIILFIFTLNKIDTNSKIGIYILLMLALIVLLSYYNINNTIENFVIVNNKNLTDGNLIYYSASSVIYNNNYMKALDYYKTFLTRIAGNGINIEILQPMTRFIDKSTNIKKNKIEYYKLKNMNLTNSIELLKKSINTYYYITILITLSTILLMICLILYLINPQMLMQIFVFALIIMFIIIFYVSYKINQNTRLEQDKYYWANFNPSANMLKAL